MIGAPIILFVVRDRLEAAGQPDHAYHNSSTLLTEQFSMAFVAKTLLHFGGTGGILICCSPPASGSLCLIA